MTRIGPTYEGTNATCIWGNYSISVTYPSETTARVSVWCEIRERGGWSWDGVALYVACNGSTQSIKGGLSSASTYDATGTQIVSNTLTFDITRTSSTQYKTVSFTLIGEAYGSMPAWSSKASSYTSSETATISALNKYTLTVKAGTGGSVNTSGGSYYYGTTVSVTATPSACYNFSSWSDSGAQTHTVTVDSTKTVTAYFTALTPTAPTNCTNTRNSDNSNTVAWTNGTNFLSTTLERQVNGGSWSTLATLGTTATSYTDTSTSADNYYAYRVKHNGSASQVTSYATSGITYNTPAAPTGITGARVSGTVAGITLTGTSNTATGVRLQYSTDKETWTTVSPDYSYTQYVEYDTGGGQYYFRAAYVRGTLVSAYTDASNLVVTICAPNPPTLLAPASGAVIPKSQTDITFEWSHNTIDGSTQSAYTLQFSTDGGTTWTTRTGTTAQTRTLTNDFAVNDTVTWRVRTKGVADDYSEYSANRTFYVYQVASYSFSTNNPPATVTTMPIPYEITGTDPSGSFASGTISVLDSNNNVMYTEALTSALSGSISATEFVPEDSETYTLTASVRSTSSLETTVTATFDVDFTEPQAGTASLSYQDDTSVQITLGLEEDETAATAAYISLYRVANGNRKLLLDNAASGATYIDKYAPLNTEYTYEVVTHAQTTGALHTESVSAYIDSYVFVVMWGTSSALMTWQPSTSETISRPERSLIHYAGRELPVAYDTDAYDITQSSSFVVLTKTEYDLLRDMLISDGRAVYKTPYGEVFHAAFDLSISRADTNKAKYGDMALTITQIDGTDL